MKKIAAIFLIISMLIGCSAAGGQANPPTVITPTPFESVQLTTGATNAPIATAVPTPEPTIEITPSPTPLLAPSDPLMAYIENMSVEERIGQLCMFGFSGTSSVSSSFASIMSEYHIGNVILYGQNISRTNSDGGFSQCDNLTNDIKEHNSSSIPLLISTDVEGGDVTRFKWPSWPTHARTLGNSNDTERAFSQFLMIGEGIKNVGINVDLAPCLDVASNPDSTFLKKRIISSDASIASDIGLSCIEGLQTAGTLSIVKHFPGHGATDKDSHATTPVVYKTLDELSSYELVPFQAAVNGGVDGMMVAHIYYPNIDSDNIASMSSVLICDVLRGQMGFDGLVMSDDFRMAGLRGRYTLEDAAVQFIVAGGDLILCGANHDYQRQILSGLYAAVADGRISEQRLNQSVYRILTAKMRVTDWGI